MGSGKPFRFASARFVFWESRLCLPRRALVAAQPRVPHENKSFFRTHKKHQMCNLHDGSITLPLHARHCTAVAKSSHLSSSLETATAGKKATGSTTPPHPLAGCNHDEHVGSSNSVGNHFFWYFLFFCPNIERRHVSQPARRPLLNY